jgi:hypothetical protein
MEQIAMHETSRGPDAAPPAIKAREEQLLTLVGELLATNQELRFKVERLEQAAEHAARMAEESSAVYRLLMP